MLLLLMQLSDKTPFTLHRHFQEAATAAAAVAVVVVVVVAAAAPSTSRQLLWT